jgi:ferredoxin-NADP reductase
MIKEGLFYICGPLPMITDTERDLAQMGVDKKRIIERT